MPTAALILTVIDAANHASKVVRYCADNLPNQGRYFAMARNFAELVDAVTTGQVVKMNVSFQVALPGTLKTAPDPDSDVEEQAKFNFVGENGFDSTVTIPTFDESKIIPGTRTVDLTDGDVSDLIDGMIDGLDDDDTVLVNLQDVTDVRGDDLVSLTDAYEYHGKDRGRRK